MKKIIFISCMLLCALGIHAQTAVNKDGTLKFRGNVAIIVDCKSYTFQNGNAVKAVDDEMSASLKTALRAITMEKFRRR